MTNGVKAYDVAQTRNGLLLSWGVTMTEETFLRRVATAIQQEMLQTTGTVPNFGYRLTHQRSGGEVVVQPAENLEVHFATPEYITIDIPDNPVWTQMFYPGSSDDANSGSSGTATHVCPHCGADISVSLS